MRIPYFFTLFLIFMGWLTIKRRKAILEEKEKATNFFEKERQANTTRRKDISSLAYIHIPLESLPFQISSNEEIKKQEDIIKELSTKPIVNLTGISNTDLKLMYGAANLPLLMEYDENFITFCQATHQWGALLFEEDRLEQARQVLEFGVFSGSDVSGSYLLLAEIYNRLDQAGQIQSLINEAEKLNSLSKNNIILKLSGFVHN